MFLSATLTAPPFEASPLQTSLPGSQVAPQAQPPRGRDTFSDKPAGFAESRGERTFMLFSLWFNLMNALTQLSLRRQAESQEDTEGIWRLYPKHASAIPVMYSAEDTRFFSFALFTFPW